MKLINAKSGTNEVIINVDNISSIFYGNEKFIYVKMNNSDGVTIDNETYKKLIKNRWLLID